MRSSRARLAHPRSRCYYHAAGQRTGAETQVSGGRGAWLGSHGSGWAKWDPTCRICASYPHAHPFRVRAGSHTAHLSTSVSGTGWSTRTHRTPQDRGGLELLSCRLRGHRGRDPTQDLLWVVQMSSGSCSEPKHPHSVDRPMGFFSWGAGGGTQGRTTLWGPRLGMAHTGPGGPDQHLEEGIATRCCPETRYVTGDPGAPYLREMKTPPGTSGHTDSRVTSQDSLVMGLGEAAAAVDTPPSPHSLPPWACPQGLRQS